VEDIEAQKQDAGGYTRWQYQAELYTNAVLMKQSHLRLVKGLVV
jgi:hypothetical protein